MTNNDNQGPLLQAPPSRAVSALCEHEHAALKASGEQWPALPFAGIYPLDRWLFDSRQCPACGSTILRAVTLTRALELLFEDLLTVSPPRPTAARSACLLTQWVAQYVQPALSEPQPPAASEDVEHAPAR